MALSWTTRKYTRCLCIAYRKYSEGKSIYQREEEKQKAPIPVDGRQDTQWRKPWIQRKGEWTSKLSLFNEKNPSVQIMTALQRLPTLTAQDIKKWWAGVRVIQEVQNQKFLPDRVASLGPNLAALHFFLYRNAAVRLKDSPNWMYGFVDVDLPNSYVDGYYIEAVDCTDFHHGGIRYEGVQNLFGLSYLKWLSLKNNPHVDSWCLDRIAGQNGKSLEYLDLTNCKLDVGCVFAIAKMTALRMLIVSEPGDNSAIQSALSALEQAKPTLVIKTVLDSSTN